MPVTGNQPVEDLLSADEYLAGRMFAGCPILQTAGNYVDADAAFAGAVDWGAWLLDQDQPQLDQMPKVVISTNQINSRIVGGDCEFTGEGIVAAHVFFAQPTGTDQTWAGRNFYGALMRELAAQARTLNAPGTYFSDRALPLKQIEVLGPTRTPANERGHAGELDYWDAVFMLHWSAD